MEPGVIEMDFTYWFIDGKLQLFVQMESALSALWKNIIYASFQGVVYKLL